MTHLYLLHGGQVLQLGVVDLLLQHQLLEVLSGIRLPLQRLQGLEGEGAEQTDRRGERDVEERKT